MMNSDLITPKFEADDEGSMNDDEPEVVIRTGINYFKDYVSAKGHSLQSLAMMPPAQIADYLKDFYTTMKSQDVEPFPSSLKYIRTGLQKYFMKHHGIDIVKDRDFVHANSVFDVTVKQVPRRCHRLRIEFEDLRKLYMGPALDLDQPDTLQNKVFFDVNLYICNRGKDFLRVMSKSDFEVATDMEGRRYVWLKYNSKFSFKELIGGLSENDSVIHGNQIGERMYERPGDPKCPVASFLQYLTHLHPMTEAFWQRPKRNFVSEDYVWYDNTPLGNSTISKIMTRTCQMAGLFENYTNHAIKSTYVPVIENICLEAARKSQMEGSRNSPPLQQRRQVSRTDSGIGEGSVCSDFKDGQTDDLDEAKDGLRQAKMKVLDVVHGLEVRDIRTFVEWLKTFRVEYDGGGLMVMCSPVDQNNSEVIKPKIDLGLVNGDRLREYSPTPPLKNKSGSPSPMVLKNIDPLSRLSHQDSREKLMEDRAEDLGVAVKQVDFECVNNTYCSTSSIDPLKITVPSENSVLLSAVSDNVQVLVHNKDSPSVIPEPLKSRIFYSQHEKDVAVLSILSNKEGTSKTANASAAAVSEKVDCSKILQDKHKPVKKRSLTDLHAGIPREEYEMPPRKQPAMSTIPPLIPKCQQTSEFKPTSIYNVPMLSQVPLYDRLPRSRNMPFAPVHRSHSSPLITFANSAPSTVLRNPGENGDIKREQNK
ncbi:uncharacterized protein LOC133180708 [Saccostrea echinata]|uniref:uncharacterized protein LOC133180708 n=1 Tax=Saccostrea echinata TaxID=191078 RepID=UPI002A7ED088|nr:uncharacterized protein LOC133180708 [Saccostrea echinata]